MFEVQRIGLKRLSQEVIVRFEVTNYGEPKRKAWVDLGTKERAAEHTQIRELGISIVSH